MLLELLKHGCGWVKVHAPLVAQVAEVVVRDEAFSLLVQIVEDHKDVFGAELYLERLQAYHEMIVADPAIAAYVEETESWTYLLESFLDTNPNKLHSPSQMYVFRGLF